MPGASGGVDVFASQNSGVVMALRSDGTQAWSATVGVGARLIPDFLGGLVVAGSSNQRLDGQTGQPTAQLNARELESSSLPPSYWERSGRALSVLVSTSLPQAFSTIWSGPTRCPLLDQ